MKKEYDFSKAQRGPVVPLKAGKTRITIRIDTEILDWFRNKVHEAGGGNYQSLINETLRAGIRRQDKDLEETLRRVIKEELDAKFIFPGSNEVNKRPSIKRSREQSGVLGITKSDLITQVAGEAQISKRDAEKVINSTIQIISGALESQGRMTLEGLGTLKVKGRNAKQARKINIAAPEKASENKAIK